MSTNNATTAAPSNNTDEGSDREKFEHDLIAALEAEEGRELEEIQPTSSNDDDEDDDNEIEEDEDDSGEGPKKKKTKKKKDGPAPPKKPAAPKKPGRAKKAAATATDETSTKAKTTLPTIPPPQLPKMPASGPGVSALETDLAQTRLWIKALVSHAEEALLSNESIANVKANQVVATYAKVLREAVFAVTNLEKRYEEAHRVFIAYSFEARRTETYGDRRGPGAYAPMGK
jgi:hypothetical protein